MISDNLLTEILNQVYRNTQRLDDMEFPEILNTGGGTGIQDATYLVNSANPNLTNEVVVTATRGALIVGNATPAWAVTAHPGAANRILITDANDALWSANTLDLTGNSVLNGSLTGGGTVETGGFTGTIPATANFAMGAGTLTQATGNDDTIANHTHAITTTNDGTGIIAATIAAFNASGQLTASDYFTNDGGQFGISGNELLTVDAAGLFKFTGIAGVTVEDGDYIGIASDVRIKFDATSGYIDAILGDAAGSDEFRILDSGGTAVITGDSDGNGYFAGSVGIKNAPSYELDISGRIRTLSSNYQIRIEDVSDTGNEWRIGTANDVDLAFYKTTNEHVRFFSGGDVSIGSVSDVAKLYVDQSSTTAATPVLTLDQADLSEEFINFVSSVGAGYPIDTAAIGTYYGKARVAVNGTFKYIALYNS